MTERKPFQFKKFKEKEYEPVHLPPAWCSAICRNALNEVCVEHCAIKRDCSGFEPKPNLKLIDMPRFPSTERMSREEKFTSVTIYLAKVVDHLQGVEDEPICTPIRRPDINRSTSISVPSNIKVEDILSNFKESDTTSADQPERKDSRVRPEEVVRTSD